MNVHLGGTGELDAMSKLSTNAVNKVKAKEVAAPQVKLVTLDDVRRDPQVIAYLKRGAEQMALLGFTEHGERHASLVASSAAGATG